jgi:Fungal specific transcription factor domain
MLLQLDMTDSRRHFGIIIPEMAFSHPVLLNAILAFSARHLSRLDSIDGLIAEYYHSECVCEMIPMIQDRRAATSGELLAATTILRMYEMLERA